MLLAIDIGNTVTTLGIFDRDELRATWHFSTDINRMPDEYTALLLNLLHNQGLKPSDVTKAAICCVVPPLLTTYEEIFQRYFNLDPLVVASGVKTGVRIRMDNPREVGADRIVNAAAAHQLYESPVIIVDLGTATTFDVVAREGDYLGGVIAPGINTATEALFRNAAMLPRVEMVPPPKVIGTNTVSAMQSGIIYGYVSLIEGIIIRIQNEMAEKSKVIATGGWAGTIAHETPLIQAVNPDLTLIGLKIIYYMNRV